MKVLRLVVCGSMTALFISAASPAFAVSLANRVFVSARSGSDANACNSITTPCQTFAGAVTQLNPDGEVIVLDSGGYGPLTITQGMTIEAPAGVTAFIHPPSGDAITVSAGSTDVVTLRGLVLNVGTNAGITINAVGTLNVENCSITGFGNYGIAMLSTGRLNVKNTDIKRCFDGVYLANAAGLTRTSIDHCHLDLNTNGYFAATTSPGSSATTATYTTASQNTNIGWIIGNSTSGKDVLNLEFCTASENLGDGLVTFSSNGSSVASYSNCTFADNGSYGVERFAPGTILSRGNSTITGNGMGATNGTIAPLSGM